MSRRSQGLIALRELIQNEGLAKAYQGLIRVLDDPKSPPTALATAATSMLKAGGALDRQDDEASEVEPSEMSYEQLQDSIAELRKRAETSTVGLEPSDTDDTTGVFD